MALTVESEQRLERVGLVKFFMDSGAEWCNYAQQSLDFLARTFPPRAVIHKDDVAKVLFPVMEVNDSLAVYLSGNQLKQKYWLTDFCDLIIDRCWEQLKMPEGMSGKKKKG